jgi:hypothetical protein
MGNVLTIPPSAGLPLGGCRFVMAGQIYSKSFICSPRPKPFLYLEWTMACEREPAFERMSGVYVRFPQEGW